MKLFTSQSETHMHTKNRKPSAGAPLSFAELDHDVEQRANKVEQEFQQGLQFIKQFEKSVTFFGSARTDENDIDYKAARHLAAHISKQLGYAIVTGGGPGIMEAANRGAHDAGGHSVGLTIRLPYEQETNPYLTHHLDFYYFFSRKVTLTFAAEAYVYFPGGFGTMDEFFEILTLVQTGKIAPVPLILVGKKYWAGLDSFIKKQLEKNEKIDDTDRQLYTITDDEDEILEIIKRAPIRSGHEAK
jgi:uncharacterized protein (TIGR00730 family)